MSRAALAFAAALLVVALVSVFVAPLWLVAVSGYGAAVLMLAASTVFARA